MTISTAVEALTPNGSTAARLLRMVWSPNTVLKQQPSDLGNALPHNGVLLSKSKSQLASDNEESQDSLRSVLSNADHPTHIDDKMRPSIMTVW